MRSSPLVFSPGTASPLLPSAELKPVEVQPFKQNAASASKAKSHSFIGAKSRQNSRFLHKILQAGRLMK
jgi:hypothetical protein